MCFVLLLQIKDENLSTTPGGTSQIVILSLSFSIFLFSFCLHYISIPLSVKTPASNQTSSYF